MPQPRRKDVGLGDNRGRWVETAHPKGAEIMLDPQPSSRNVASRRTAIQLIDGPLAPYREALTLIGGPAVMLRTTDRFGLNTETVDADFAITPQLVTDEPNLETQLLAAGFQLRSESRPGLWGRDPYIDPVSGRQFFNEMFDLDCPQAFTGNASPKRRSSTALHRHGRRSTGATPGVELAAVDRGLMDVPDLADPSRRTSMWVASQAGLICAKGYKIGERLYETDGRREPKGKDYLDLFLLLDSSDPDTVRDVFRWHGADSVIGGNVRHGAALLARALRDERVSADLVDAIGGRVPTGVVDAAYETWRWVFPA